MLSFHSGRAKRLDGSLFLVEAGDKQIETGVYFEFAAAFSESSSLPISAVFLTNIGIPKVTTVLQSYYPFYYFYYLISSHEL